MDSWIARSLTGADRSWRRFFPEGMATVDVWMILTPRQADAVRQPLPLKNDNGALLRMLQAKLVRGSLDTELTLSEHELNQVKAAARNWRGGHKDAFQAVLTAAGMA